VRNAGTVWLGLTLGCAECHDHKFDPFTTKEFYRFASFFADIKEKAVGRQDQTPVATRAQETQLAKLEAQIAPLQKVLDTPTAALDMAQIAWEADIKAKGTKGLPQEIATI